MKYGYFDDDAKEYVITRPDTPRPWSNYLGTTEYGAIITNHAGGYSFYKSAATGRFLRMRFNSVPLDQPGRYFYLRDCGSGDYWSSSWQPVGRPLDRCQSVCRHGTAYTQIENTYAGIRTESLYFVPLGQTFEYWRLRVTNQSPGRRALAITTYCEFANHWHTYQDLVNLQYSLFITRATIEDGVLGIANNPNQHFDGRDLTGCGRSWMALTGAPLSGWETRREVFRRRRLRRLCRARRDRPGRTARQFPHGGRQRLRRPSGPDRPRAGRDPRIDRPPRPRHAGLARPRDGRDLRHRRPLRGGIPPPQGRVARRPRVHRRADAGRRLSTTWSTSGTPTTRSSPTRGPAPPPWSTTASATASASATRCRISSAPSRSSASGSGRASN